MKSNMVHDFSRAPTADIPRSSFNRTHGHKTTFDAGFLIPVYVDEALPGDTFNLKVAMFGRLATPIHPLMDNLFMDIHFFSVPMRQLWDNFRKFMGEQTNPADSIDFTMPVVTAGIYGQNELGDYFGLPIGFSIAPNALFFRAYNHIYNEWYRDQNLIDSATVATDDGPDNQGDYVVQRRGKRYDYFTSSLPWPQKGDSVSVPLGTSAPLNFPGAINDTAKPFVDVVEDVLKASGTSYTIQQNVGNLLALTSSETNVVQAYASNTHAAPFADLSTATAATINQLRQAFQIQKLLERDARSGTRYSEIVKSHFGVNFYDPSYRPEYLGGSSTPITIHPVPQTSETLNTPQGNLAAFGTMGLNGQGFTKSFTEHCVVMGIASVRADLTYQQGINRMFSRSTRYDYYWPSLSHIGEQAVLSKEIYVDGSPGDEIVFGYQERYAEYKYKPSIITGLFRSAATSSLDSWHLSQEFLSRPELNRAFIEENPPVDRVIEVASEPHFIADFLFDLQTARPMPLYSVPGLIDHF